MPRKQKNRQEGGKDAPKTTRRDVIKMGVVGGAATVLTAKKSFRTHNVFAQDVASAPPPEPTVCDPNRFHNSPRTTPFMQQLPIPPQLQSAALSPAPQKSANIAGGEAPRADHQRWNEFLPVKQYALHARPSLWQFHPEIPPSYVWAFNGSVPGPTIINKYGQPVVVRFYNELPTTHTLPFAIPEITIHLHNGHTASESDGFAGDFFGTGLFKDNHYANIYAGYDAFGAPGDPKEAQFSYWYHDHRAMFTAANSYLGLAGMYWLFDSRDSGNENDPNPNALRLPSGYGVHDIPLIFSDRTFCSDGTMLAFSNGIVPEGDKWTVNGAIQPALRVNRRKYRFRLLNTGPQRTYFHQLTNNFQFTVVATDGNLLEHPITVDTITHSVAERYDVIIDFSTANIGDFIYLLNTDDEGSPQYVGRQSPSPLPHGVTIDQVVMRFDVVGNEADNSQVPATLTQYPNINVPIAATKTWEFTRDITLPLASQFRVNNLTFDAARSDHQAVKGTAEIWTIRNLVPASDWTHPVHIHFEEFRVLSRNGAPPPPLETGRKDVIRIPPGNEVVIFMQFRDFLGRYLIHCHNMNHEDNFMMVRWDIVDSLAQKTRLKEVVG